MLLRSDAPVKVYTDLRAAERDKLIIKSRVKFKDYSAVSEYHSKVSELYLVKERFYSYEG